jgi:hypothetical protein
MEMHNLKRQTKRITSMDVGRGGKRGKTAGRGTKDKMLVLVVNSAQYCVML